MIRVPLADVAPAKAANISFASDELVWILTLDQIESNTGRLNGVPNRRASDAGTSTFPFDEGNVLYSKLRPYLNKVVCPDRPGIATTELVPLRPDPKRLDRAYLCHYLRSPPFVSWISSRTAGAKMPRVQMKDFWAHKMPLPPLPEQKRIAAILDKADDIHRKRQKALAFTDDFLRSVFLDMFGDPVTNPNGWTRRPLNTFLLRIDGGWSPKCEDRAVSPGEWGVLKLGSVTTTQYLHSENKALPAGISPRPELEVAKGDLLFSRKNTYSLVAACAYVHETEPKLMLPDLIFRFVFKDEADLLPEYLWALLTDPGKRKIVQGLARGAAGSMPNISKERLLSLDIERPPRKHQEQFARLFHQVWEAKKDLVRAVGTATTLSDSVRQRAFRGEL